MKRYGDIYSKIINMDNLRLADANARKGKACTYGVVRHDKNRDANIKELQDLLEKRAFKTSEYKVFTVFTPKERVVYQLPYYPDRIVHHAVMNVLEPLWVSTFIRDTYACVKKRGIHDAMLRVKKSLTDVQGTKYCLKLDIRKFYPSVDHTILKNIIARKIKCKDTLALLGEIIDSAPGIPIGNYLSQYFANLYLTYFDHFLKEKLQVKYVFRYADDIVILHADKTCLHKVLFEIGKYLREELKLDVKSNYQIFPVDIRGVDFVGFVFRHGHTRMRKNIKKNFCRRLSKIGHLGPKEYKMAICGWTGWAKYSDSRHFNKLNIKHNEQSILRRTA